MLTGRAGLRGGVRHLLKPCKPVARTVVKQHSSRLCGAVRRAKQGYQDQCCT